MAEMDPHISIQMRDELWRMQADLKSSLSTQAEHSDRLLRIERRLDEDSRMKSVWGTSSSFPGMLSGTPQQDAAYNPAAEAFKSFDQDQTSGMLGSLHLDTEEEPRRGASRANSVRFDESALHGHFSHNSRSSSEFFPVRTGSASGSHPMTERSSSHKSDGRQSSTGHSAHSTRLNSLGPDSRPPNILTTMPTEPPPGLALLGPLPCIIRCWLDTQFSNDNLLYAAICSGSYKSVLSLRLAQRLHLLDGTSTADGSGAVKLQVYLPEATVQHLHNASKNAISQLPTITVPFEIVGTPFESESIDIILGSDILRSKSADISFSRNRVTLLDDMRNTLEVPLVRPENRSCYKQLLTTSNNNLRNTLSSGDRPTNRFQIKNVSDAGANGTAAGDRNEAAIEAEKFPEDLSNAIEAEGDFPHPSRAQRLRTQTTQTQVEKQHDLLSSPRQSERSFPSANDSRNQPVTTISDKSEQISQATSWRRDGSSQRPDSTFSSIASGAGNAKVNRGKQMKILRPSRSNTSSSPTAFSLSPSTNQSFWPDNKALHNQTSFDAPAETSLSQTGTTLLDDQTNPPSSLESKQKPRNPIGGASAFGWLNATRSR